jgi:hypothetical protein
VVHGAIIGMWRRTFSQKSVVIECAPFRPLTTAENAAFTAAAERFGAFLGLPVITLPTTKTPGDPVL